MKQLLLFWVLTLISSLLYAQDYKESECYQKYKAKDKKKIDRRERQINMMIFGINLQTSSGANLNFRPNNYSPDEIDFFEREVIAASDFDLKSYIELGRGFSPPPFLTVSYEKARKKIPTTTYYEVQKALRESFADGELCKWYGIMRPNQVSRMIISKIKENHKEGSHQRAPAVVDSERSETKEINPEENQRLIDGIQIREE